MSALNHSIPVISLFSGAGGLDLGFQQQGFRTVLALDVDKAAVETYNANKFDRCAVQCDLGRIQGAELMALVEGRASGIRPRGVIGGPPCQTFSIGNVRKNTNDRRGALGLHYARLLGALNRGFELDFFVFENVTGLKNPKHSRRYKDIVSALEGAGFDVFVAQLNSNSFGIAQNRKRLFLVGINSRRFPWLKYQFPHGIEGKPRNVGDAIRGLPEPIFFQRSLTADQIPFHPNHWTMRPRSPKFGFGKSKKSDGRSFRRLEWGKPSRTVAYGNREIHLHPRGHRRLSVLEAMLLQGFRVDFVLRGNLSEQVTQVSNAVPPPLAAALAQTLHSQLYGQVHILHQSLLDWFRTHQRRFPWRKERDPFKVLVAEKLLQQTAANRHVVQAYRAFLRAFPNSQALAKARPAAVKRIIEPLGLHYRGVEMIELAKALCDRHDGAVPSTLKELLALPGIGDYCARAVLAFAYGKQVPVVDTNVARFLSRFFGLKFSKSANPSRNRQLLDVATALVPDGMARDFNLAILDLCAAHCSSDSPTCTSCPLRKQCRYAQPPKLADPSSRPERSDATSRESK